MIDRDYEIKPVTEKTCSEIQKKIYDDLGLDEEFRTFLTTRNEEFRRVWQEWMERQDWLLKGE